MNQSTASLDRGAHIEHTALRAVFFHHVRLSGAELYDVDITGDVDQVTINGVDIGPLVEAELNRRHPDRASGADDPRTESRLYRRPWADATADSA